MAAGALCYNNPSPTQPTAKGLPKWVLQKTLFVTLNYEMFDANDQLIDKTEQPIAYLHGGYDGIFPLVEEALHGKEVGDTVDVVLSPDDAFGEQDPELVRIADVGVFPGTKSKPA